ncbi:hypothetical protein ACFL0H_01910 [Thermodesulfobacteriota bacterium]
MIIRYTLLYTLATLVAITASSAFCSEGPFENIANPKGAEGYTFSRKYVGLPVDQSMAIDQMKVSDVICGPTAVLNAMLFGNNAFRSCYESVPGNDGPSKLSFVVNEYGRRPSTEYSNKPRIDKDGISSVDLLHLFNDLLTDNGDIRVNGEYIVRTKDEPSSDFLKKAHHKLLNSLKRGVPVVAHIRSFAAKRNHENEKMYWYSLSSHYVTITKIPERLSGYEKGFIFEYIDPYRAEIESGYIGVEMNRGFNAKIGANKNYKWIKGKSLLLVRAPSLNLKTSEQRWHNRSIMTLNYVIGNIN